MVTQALFRPLHARFFHLRDELWACEEQICGFSSDYVGVRVTMNLYSNDDAGLGFSLSNFRAI